MFNERVCASACSSINDGAGNVLCEEHCIKYAHTRAGGSFWINETTVSL